MWPYVAWYVCTDLQHGRVTVRRQVRLHWPAAQPCDRTSPGTCALTCSTAVWPYVARYVCSSRLHTTRQVTVRWKNGSANTSSNGAGDLGAQSRTFRGAGDLGAQSHTFRGAAGHAGAGDLGGTESYFQRSSRTCSSRGPGGHRVILLEEQQDMRMT